METQTTRDSISGAILGTAVGDALGLPYEGLSPRRARKLLGPPDRYRFIFGRGMISDDTEHTCLVAQSLISSRFDPETFERDLARRLRWWLLGLPAGIGFATLRAIVKLWLGVSPANSGVFSAGNGPAMRSAIIGASVDDPEGIRELVRRSSRITHADPKAEYGAFGVAMAARSARKQESVDTHFQTVRDWLPEGAEEFIALLEKTVASVDRAQTTEEFAAELCGDRGVSGYIYQTAPVCIHAWLRHPTDFRSAIMSVVRCGGDADSTAAITGGIVGAAVGPRGIPDAWRSGLGEWPRTVAWMEKLANQLDQARTLERSPPPIGVCIPAQLARNLGFLAIVLSHGARRAFPPY